MIFENIGTGRLAFRLWLLLSIVVVVLGTGCARFTDAHKGLGGPTLPLKVTPTNSATVGAKAELKLEPSKQTLMGVLPYTFDVPKTAKSFVLEVSKLGYSSQTFTGTLSRPLIGKLAIGADVVTTGLFPPIGGTGLGYDLATGAGRELSVSEIYVGLSSMYAAPAAQRNYADPAQPAPAALTSTSTAAHVDVSVRHNGAVIHQSRSSSSSSSDPSQNNAANPSPPAFDSNKFANPR